MSDAGIVASTTILPFFGGLIGAFVGSPLLELLKDRLGARRAGQNHRKEVIERLKLTIGVIDGFFEIKDYCIRSSQKLSDVKIEFNKDNREYFLGALREYDLDVLLKEIIPISRIASNKIEFAATNNYLVNKLLVLVYLMKTIQIHGDMTQESFVDLVNERKNDLYLFINSIYLKDFGIDSSDLKVFSKVSDFERRLGEIKIFDSQRRLDRNLKALDEFTKKNHEESDINHADMPK